MKLWNRPAIQILAVFLVLGLFAWWTFRTVSLPPALRDLFEEDEAIATAAAPLTGDERLQAELPHLPRPPEDHAPQVAELLARLRNLPPVPYLVQAARQRDAAAQGSATPPAWSPAEQAALDQISVAYLKAWEPFFQAPPVSWDRYPDSVRLFRSQLAELLDMPHGYNLGSHFLLFSDLNLYKPLRHLGALRFGRDFLLQNGWAALDTVALAESTKLFFIDALMEAGLPHELSVPAPPQIEDIRLGLRSDRALFLRAASYFESLPPETPAALALRRFLGNGENADWFLERISGIKTASALARYLRQDAALILELENKTFLSGMAWRQWLETGNPSSGLSPTLQDSLQGLRDFEKARLAYQVSVAFCGVFKKYQEGDRSSAQRIPDPAQPGTFLRLEESETGLKVSSALPSLENPASRTFVIFPAPQQVGANP